MDETVGFFLRPIDFFRYSVGRFPTGLSAQSILAKSTYAISIVEEWVSCYTPSYRYLGPS